MSIVYVVYKPFRIIGIRMWMCYLMTIFDESDTVKVINVIVLENVSVYKVKTFLFESVCNTVN